MPEVLTKSWSFYKKEIESLLNCGKFEKSRKVLESINDFGESHSGITKNQINLIKNIRDHSSKRKMIEEYP